MNITQITIRKTFANGQLKAIVSIVLDYCLAIHDIKIIEGNNRLFVAMPAHKGNDGIYRDIIHPMYPDVREYFEAEILTAYEEHIAMY